VFEGSEDTLNCGQFWGKMIQKPAKIVQKTTMSKRKTNNGVYSIT